MIYLFLDSVGRAQKSSSDYVPIVKFEKEDLNILCIYRIVVFNFFNLLQSIRVVIVDNHNTYYYSYLFYYYYLNYLLFINKTQNFE